MKRNQILAVLSAFGMTVSSLGADPTTVFWGFDTADNPAIGTPDTTNPYPSTGTAEINSDFGEGYFPGTVVIPDVPLNFGTATGVWDIGGAQGGVTMGLDLYDPTPGTPLAYTVVVRQFASTAPQVGFPYSPNVTFSVPGWALDSQVEKEITVNGTWIESTYTWQQVAASGGITLTMSSDPGKGLLLDSLAFSVLGDLVPIPEPSASQLGGLAALMLGIGAFRRSKTTA